MFIGHQMFAYSLLTILWLFLPMANLELGRTNYSLLPCLSTFCPVITLACEQTSGPDSYRDALCVCSQIKTCIVLSLWFPCPALATVNMHKQTNNKNRQENLKTYPQGSTSSSEAPHPKGSASYPNSAIIWEPSVQTHEPEGAISHSNHVQGHVSLPSESTAMFSISTPL